ncbi:MAG TPA: hypothetical protein VFW25_07890 [Silvibacterium sp.]|nr:hypothetical protein [Silvibacterium sp.]
MRDGVSYEFHHLGIPSQEIRAGERFSAKFGMYTSDSECGLARVQWHRFEPESPLDPLIRSHPHPAFKVSNLEAAIAGRRLLIQPYEPIDGYRVAIIEDGGIPIELIETQLSDVEIWDRAAHKERTSIY